MFRIVRVNSDNPDFLQLVGHLTVLLAELNGEQDAFYAPFNKVDHTTRSVVAYDGAIAVGCGALRPTSETTAEVKRMFVNPDFRGRGVGRAVLSELEALASDLGFEEVVLETSRRLDRAVGLYGSAGFEVIPNYPPYTDVADSICFRKRL